MIVKLSVSTKKSDTYNAPPSVVTSDHSGQTSYGGGGFRLCG